MCVQKFITFRMLKYLIILTLFYYLALSAVKSFLPKMAQANVKLQEKIASESLEAVNIENTDNCEGPIIEMVSMLI